MKTLTDGASVFAGAHVVAHHRLSDGDAGDYRRTPPIDVPRRRPLLWRRRPTRVQHRIDKDRNRGQLRPVPRRVAVRRRHRAGNCLTYHALTHAEFRRNVGNRVDPGLMLLTKLLEQFHFGFSMHAEPPAKNRVTLG